MRQKHQNARLSLIWGNLRNLIDFNNFIIPMGIKLVGTVPGEFPVDSYNPVFLEIPKELKKPHLYARFGILSAAFWHNIYNMIWSPMRIVPLPLYDCDETMSLHSFKMVFQSLLQEWSKSLIPENVPCCALAVKTRGNYCEEREAQNVVVLLIWPSNVARVLSLEWFEGPVEDCISPEWYLTSSQLLALKSAIWAFKEKSEFPSNWTELYHSVSVNPLYLGTLLTQGKRITTNRKGWSYEWVYRDLYRFAEDLDLILGELTRLFLWSGTESSLLYARS